MPTARYNLLLRTYCLSRKYAEAPTALNNKWNIFPELLGILFKWEY